MDCCNGSCLGVHLGSCCGRDVSMNAAEIILLKRIQSGHLRMKDGVIEYYHFQRRRWYVKKPNQHPVSGRYRFVSSDGQGGRTTVYRNRLVWMIENKQPIPDDYFIDHEDGNRLNDSPWNLKLMQRSDSCLQGYGVQADQNFRSVCNWFEFISIYNRPPTEEEEGGDSLLFI